MGESTTCPLCELLSDLKETDEWYKTNSARHCDTWTIYKSAVVAESYSMRVDGCTGTCTYHFSELNFCPLCGKDLRGELNNV